MERLAEKERRAHVGLLILKPDINYLQYSTIREKFGSIKSFLSASTSSIETSEGLSPELKIAVIGQRKKIQPEKLLAEWKKKGVRYMTIQDPDYPAYLQTIHDPPLVIFYRGNKQLFDRPALAIIGTRKPTQYGIQVAQYFAKELATRNIVVVSGLALGIDVIAQKSAFEAGGQTIGVLGSGVLEIYPHANEDFGKTLIKSDRGLLMSEFLPDIKARPFHFPLRNRLVSGLSRGVIVIEGSKKSGTLITTSLALDQGREVFAVPGSIFAFNAQGPHYLIQQGAKLVTTIDDVLEEFRSSAQLEFTTGEDVQNFSRADLHDHERAILNFLKDSGEQSANEIIRHLAIPASETLLYLTQLALKNLIKDIGDKRYIVRK